METQRVIYFPTEAEVKRACKSMKTMGGIYSFKILYFLLQSGETCVKDVSEACLINQGSVSTYLDRMKLSGLVKSRRDAKRVYYSCVSPEAIKTILETALKL